MIQPYLQLLQSTSRTRPDRDGLTLGVFRQFHAIGPDTSKKDIV